MDPHTPLPGPGSDLSPGSALSSDTAALDNAAHQAPADPLTQEVAGALERSPQQRTWLQGAILLAVTLAMFAMSGIISAGPADLLLLIAVLLFHEGGHYLGMRLFNYQDVRMFFIPFFGAAVSGRSTSVQGYKEAIVILLGPLPGIVLGVALGTVCMFQDSPILRSAAVMLLAVNGFNLLPLLPLDGGRLLHLIVFSRQRHLEVAFRLVTAVLLVLCGWALGAWLLAGLGVFMLLGIHGNFQMSKVSEALRVPLPPGAALNLSTQIPPERALPLIDGVRAAFPQVKHVPTLVNLTRQVWERMHMRPPGVLASLMLLALYAGAFLGTPIVALLFHLPIKTVTSNTRPDGTVTRSEVVRSWGRLQTTTELDASGRYHGRHRVFFPPTGRILVEGTFVDGRAEGVWITYGPEGQILSRTTYRQGRLAPAVIAP